MLLKSKSFRSAPIALNANPARGRGIILFHREIFHSEIPHVLGQELCNALEKQELPFRSDSTQRKPRPWSGYYFI